MGTGAVMNEGTKLACEFHASSLTRVQCNCAQSTGQKKSCFGKCKAMVQNVSTKVKVCDIAATVSTTKG